MFEAPPALGRQLHRQVPCWLELGLVQFGEDGVDYDREGNEEAGGRDGEEGGADANQLQGEPTEHDA